MNNKYISWVRKHPITVTVGTLFIIGIVFSKTPITYLSVQGRSLSEDIVTIDDHLDVLEKDNSSQVVVTPEPDLKVCAEMKESLVVINTSLQQKKSLLKQVKSMGREEVPEDDYQTQLKETAVKKNSLEGNIAQLEVRQKELIDQIKQESCI